MPNKHKVWIFDFDETLTIKHTQGVNYIPNNFVCPEEIIAFFFNAFLAKDRIAIATFANEGLVRRNLNDLKTLINKYVAENAGFLSKLKNFLQYQNEFMVFIDNIVIKGATIPTQNNKLQHVDAIYIELNQGIEPIEKYDPTNGILVDDSGNNAKSHAEANKKVFHIDNHTPGKRIQDFFTRATLALEQPDEPKYFSDLYKDTFHDYLIEPKIKTAIAANDCKNITSIFASHPELEDIITTSLVKQLSEHPKDEKSVSLAKQLTEDLKAYPNSLRAIACFCINQDYLEVKILAIEQLLPSLGLTTEDKQADILTAGYKTYRSAIQKAILDFYQSNISTIKDKNRTLYLKILYVAALHGDQENFEQWLKLDKLTSNEIDQLAIAALSAVTFKCYDTKEQDKTKKFTKEIDAANTNNQMVTKLAKNANQQKSNILATLIKSGANIQNILTPVTEQGNQTAVELLLNAGAIPTFATVQTALRKGHGTIALLLLKRCKKDNKEVFNDTLLHEVAKGEVKNHNEIIYFLIKKRGFRNLTCTDGTGKTPLQHAKNNKNNHDNKIANILLQYGATTNLSAPKTDFWQSTATTQSNPNGLRQLFDAIISNDYETTITLLKHPNIKVLLNDADAAYQLLQLAITGPKNFLLVEALLEHGAKQHMSSSTSSILLIAALSFHHTNSIAAIDIAETLLNNGARISSLVEQQCNRIGAAGKKLINAYEQSTTNSLVPRSLDLELATPGC